jgi:hypothetical protein
MGSLIRLREQGRGADDMSSQERAVRHLTNFYGVVAGLAISNAVLNLISPEGKVLVISLPTALLFIVFITTLLPFYHGAMRHLEATYVEQSSQTARSGALMADFVLLFMEACLFLALAVLIHSPAYFAWGYVTLLALDVCWGFFAHLAGLSAPGCGGERKWAKINFSTVLLLLVLLYLEDIGWSPSEASPGLRLCIALLTIATLRTIIDYWWAWNAYFPSESQQAAK